MQIDLNKFVPFYRDTLLKQEVLDIYKTGKIYHEPSFFDASYKFGGLVAPHRYFIISPHAICLDQFSENPQWGLCVWKFGREFKVLDIIRKDSKAQITLLDVTENELANCSPKEIIAIESEFIAKAREMFYEALKMPPLPELNNDVWRERLVYPMGIDSRGKPFLKGDVQKLGQ